MSVSDQLADTIRGEQKRWAALAGLDAPLPEVAKNGNLCGLITLRLCLIVMGVAFIVGPAFIQILVLYGLVAVIARAWVMVYQKLTV